MVRAGSRRQIDEIGSDDDTPRGNVYKRAKTEIDGDDLSSSDLDSLKSDDEEVDVDDSEGSDYEDPTFDDDELLAAYNRFKRKQKGYTGTASKAGIIKSISLIDFMCHRHLTVDFGPRMNFVIGRNGSGKSAVLTGIAAALGGKANITGRGSGLKDLIRKGCDRAIITIILANSGEEAYRPDVYKPNIVIERTIHVNGSSGYKFKGAKDGKTIANKKSELTSICDYFNINIDSPLTVLTQDQSRSFLQNADPHKLYKFFLNGTQLSTLLDSYESSSQNIAQLDNYIKRQKEAIPDLKTKLEGLKRKIQASKKVVKQKKKNKQLLVEMAWSYVREKEEARDEEQGQVQVLKEKIDLVQQKIHESEKEMPQMTDRILETEADVKNQDESLKPLIHAVKQAQFRHIEARKQLRTMQASIEDIEVELREEKLSLARLEKKIEEQLRRSEPDQIEAHERLIQRRAKAEEILSKIRLERPAREKERDDKFKEQVKLKQELATIEYDISRMDQQKALAKKNFENISRQKDNRIAAFGVRIEPLLDEINNTRWVEKPLGPLGMYVRLEDMRYADVLQRLMGSALCAFAVKHHEDRIKLSEIIKRHFNAGYRPGNIASLTNAANPPWIFKHAGDLFDYSSGDLSGIGPTVLSICRISNQEVLRILIDNSHIEKTFVAPTIVEANALMNDILKNHNIDYVTVNCADGMTTTGSHRNRHSGPTTHYRGTPLFADDIASEIADAEAQIHTLETTRQGAFQSLEPIRQRIGELQSDMAELTASIKSLQQKMRPVEVDLDNTKRKLAEMASTEMDSSEALREEVKENIIGLELKIQQHRSDISKQKHIIEECQAEIGVRQQEADAHAPRKEKLIALLGRLVEERSRLENDQRHYQKSLTGYEQRLQRAEETLEELEADVVSWEEKAKIFAPVRVYTQRKSAELEQEKASLDRSIAEASRALGHNLDELTIDYRREKLRFANAAGSVKDLKSLHMMFEKAMRNRREWWGQTRSHIAIRARTAFVVFESFRGLDGRLEFNHGTGKLSLLVHNQVSTESHDGTLTQTSHYKGAKALSGGERSFSTVSLLLALWSTVPCPLRALDEWDVFLDAANRRVAAKNLMQGAKETDGKQYILITPLDMQGIDTSGPDKKVIRMADPERGQGTID